MQKARAVDRLIHWLCSGAIVCIAAGVAPELVFDAEARPRTRLICEEWRDYYYNVDTGEFIEWVGPPYELCYWEDEPISRPANPHPDYTGGWGIPRDPKKPTCGQCQTNADQCVDETQEGSDSCLNHHRKWARSWCERHHTDIDNRLVDDFKCENIEGPSGKPVRRCHGPGMDRCAESFENGSPVRTTEDGKSWVVNVLDFFDIGDSETTTVTYGGNRGFKDGCRDAEQLASYACEIQKEICQEEAGGCE